jgi:hypothetical protein
MIEEPTKRAVDPRPGQTPPDVTCTIKSGGTELIKMAGVGLTARDDYAANTEYWRSGTFTTTPFDVAGLTMEYAKIPETGRDIDAYFDPMSARFTATRSPAAWNSGQHTHAGVTSYLFSMDDPDSATVLRNKLGVLIEIDSTRSNVVVGVAFYKMSGGPQVWDLAPPTSGVATWTLSRVKDSAGANSTNPNDIPTGWFHTLMGT